ncbi:MAG: PilN domain-containing protein [Gammaproteobacteria bacterium]
MTIRINLLPHRELRRERRKKDFIAILVATVVAGAGIAALVALGIGSRIDAQQARNDFIKRENDKLDEQVKEIAMLREEIDSLKARQLAVENLQRDRTLPVHMMDELVRRTPDGMFFRQLRQADRKVTLTGLAQSNERVSNLLRTLAHETPWLERPELVEIKAITLGKPDPRDKDAQGRRVYEFSLNATIKAVDKAGEDEGAARQAGDKGAPVPAKPARPVAQASAVLASR